MWLVLFLCFHYTGRPNPVEEVGLLLAVWKPDLKFSYCFINTLTTNGDYSRHQNPAACYQLAQSVLKTGSALAERVGQGERSGSTAVADCAWRLLQLAMEKAWSALDGPLFCFLVQMGVENGPFIL